MSLTMPTDTDTMFRQGQLHRLTPFSKAIINHGYTSHTVETWGKAFKVMPTYPLSIIAALVQLQHSSTVLWRDTNLTKFQVTGYQYLGCYQKTVLLLEWLWEPSQIFYSWKTWQLRKKFQKWYRNTKIAHGISNSALNS